MLFRSINFLWAMFLCVTFWEYSVFGRPFVKIDKEPNMGNLEEVFVQAAAWFNICDYAYIPQGDPWVPSGINRIEACKPENIPAGSIIFATPKGTDEFLEKVSPHIKNPYILLTSFYVLAPEVAQRIKDDPKIIAWLGQANPGPVTSKKFTVIPLGVCNHPDVFLNKKLYNERFKQFRVASKPNLLYMNFKIHENRGLETEVRENVYNVFKDKEFCVKSGRKPFPEYIKGMGESVFVVSPPGDMFDCFRHWETLLCGSIPVMQTCPLDPIFEDLPVVIVDDYNCVTEEFLFEKLQELQQRNYNLRKLYMQYWVDKINKIRAKFHRKK